MDQIRALTEQARQEEAQLLAERIGITNAALRDTNRWLLGTAVVGSLAVLILFIGLGRELARRNIEHELRAHGHQLAEKVDNRTRALHATIDKLESEIDARQLLERALMDSMSTEQQKLGRDLHDGLGQELTGIAMLASVAESSLKRAGRSEAAQIKDIANIANQAVGNCRAIAHGMSPLDFVGGSLVGALQEMAKLQRDSFGIDAQCEVTEAAPLWLGTEAVEGLYRISQEAVTNVRRHSQAKSIRVALNIQPSTVRLDVVDDGIGLPQAPTTPTGMGLKIMAFRARLIGARLTIKPGEHSGTQVTVECPQRLEPQVPRMPGAAATDLGNGAPTAGPTSA
jgi:signal transduction histidine kinase